MSTTCCAVLLESFSGESSSLQYVVVSQKEQRLVLCANSKTHGLQHAKSMYNIVPGQLLAKSSVKLLVIAVSSDSTLNFGHNISLCHDGL